LSYLVLSLLFCCHCCLAEPAELVLGLIATDIWVGVVVFHENFCWFSFCSYIVGISSWFIKDVGNSKMGEDFGIQIRFENFGNNSYLRICIFGSFKIMQVCIRIIHCMVNFGEFATESNYFPVLKIWSNLYLSHICFSV
jgi:hypothetical protein